MSGVQNIDRYEVVFDDEGLVADAGLLAAGTLIVRLGLEGLVDRTVRLGGRVGGANPGRKVLTVVAAMLLGASHIDHVDRLRAGSTGRVLPHAVMAPSTVGTFLRSFTWGHVRQLEKVLTLALGRAWRLGAGPGKGPVTLDVDSTICPVSGKTKQGAAYGYTKELGYHPLLAFRADTGEVVGARLRAGASQRGVVHFVGETIRRVRRAGARGPVSVRADSGFWSFAMLAALDRLRVGWSITCRLNAKVRTLISNIDKDAWTPIAYPRGGQAQVGETVLEMTNPKKRSQRRRFRLVVRRTRLVGSQAQLWPDWRYHTFVTNLDLGAAEADRHHQPRAGQEDIGHQPRRGEQDTELTELPTIEIGDKPGEAHSQVAAVEIDQHHRRHATCELAIRDLKDSGGLAHLPSGVFAANAAWLLCAALAHNWSSPRWPDTSTKSAFDVREWTQRVGKEFCWEGIDRDASSRMSSNVDAVEIVRSSGKPIRQVANELGIYDSTLGNWVRQDGINRGEREGLTSGERERLRELERENARLRMERELLKRAVAFWVRESNE